MSNSLRLFFALPLPAQLAKEIARWRQQLTCSGSWVHEQDLHVTLAFLGSHGSTRLPDLQAAVEQLDNQAFELTLDRLGLWHGGLLHLAPSQAPAGLLQLQRDVCNRLDQANLELESRPYRPHLTLARHVQSLAYSPPVRFTWRADQFGLFHSCSSTIGPRYRQIGTWKLT